MTDPVDLPKPPRRCPICGKPAEVKYRPFCSKRCADVDLGRWFTGAYVVSGRDEDEDTPPAPDDGR